MVGIVAILHHFVSYVRNVRFKIIENTKTYKLVTLVSFYGYSNDRRHSGSCYLDDGGHKYIVA